MKSGIILIIVSLSMFLFPQTPSEMRVVGMGKQADGEFIGSNVLDPNGNICAGLIILSDLAGLQYKSYNGIVKIDRNPGRDLLYLDYTERVVEVYREGYTPLKIILSEYGIYLKSKQVYQLQITGDKKTNAVPVTIISNPEGANLIINGEDKGTEKTHILSIGKNRLEIRMPGYNSVNTEIDVSEKNAFFSYNLEKITLTKFTIRSQPKNAKVFINEIEKGVTDYQSFEVPGKYKVKITHQGYLDFEQEIEIVQNNNNEFSFPLDVNSGRLVLQLNPPDAVVKLDGEQKTGAEFELQPRNYELEVSKSGYFTKKETVKILLGETITKAVTLEKSSVDVTINTEPADAKVYINKKDYTGQKSIELPAGNYILEIEKDGYKKIEEVLSLELKKPVNRTFRLNPRYGTLQFTVKPIDASIELRRSGKLEKRWIGANMIEDLLEGDYTLTASYSGYEPAERTFSIKEGRVSQLDVNLEISDVSSEISGNIKPFRDKYEAGNSKTLAWITTGLTVLGAAVSIYYYQDLMDNYDKYKSATIQDNAKYYRSKTEDSAKIYNILIPISVGASVTSLICWIFE